MKIRKGNKGDVENLVSLHEMVFDGFFMTSLGSSFLKAYYISALKLPDTVCYVAEEDDGECLGFVFGRPYAKGYLRRVLKKGILRFAFQGLVLMFIRPKSLLRLARNLDKKDKSGAVEDSQDYAEIGLIGVKPQTKGKGVGHRLFNEFAGEVGKMGAKKISLTTDYYNNDNTLTAYKAWGFRVLYEFVTYPDRRMYRLIKDIEQ